MPDTIEFDRPGAYKSAPPHSVGRAAMRTMLRLLLLLAVFAAAVWTLFDLDYYVRRVASMQAAAQQTLQQQRGHATRLALQAARSQQGRIDDAYRFLRVIAGLSSLPAMEREACAELLRKQLINEPRYDNVGVASKNGRVHCSAFPVPTSLGLANAPRDDALLVPGWPFPAGATRHAVVVVTPIVDNDVYLGSAFTALDPAQLLSASKQIDSSHMALVTTAGVIVSTSAAARPKVAVGPNGDPVEAIGSAPMQRVYGFAKLIDATPAVYVAVGVPVPLSPSPPNDRVYARAAVLVVLVALATYLAGFGRDAFFYNLVSRLAAVARQRAKRSARSAATALKKRAAGQQQRNPMSEAEQRSQTKIELRQANQALKKALEHFEQRDREMAILNELSRHLQNCSSAGEIQAIVEQFSQQLFSDLAGMLFLLNSASGMIESRHNWGELSAQQHDIGLDDCWALRLGKAHSVSGPQASLQCPHVIDAARGGYICTPLVAHGEVLGVLHLQGRPPTDQDLESQSDTLPRGDLAQDFAERVALALANLSLRENLRVQSIRDVLTGLYNRRFLEESMAIEEQRAQRSGSAVGIVMLDIDHFKQFNDSFGHDAGDALLRELGSFLRAQVREGDTACRYGGEEFTLILPGADLDSCRQRAEVLRRNVAALKVVYQGRPLGPITLSIGVASYPQHGTSWREVLKAADRALYRAKKGGRNRVLLA